MITQKINVCECVQGDNGEAEQVRTESEKHKGRMERDRQNVGYCSNIDIFNTVHAQG